MKIFKLTLTLLLAGSMSINFAQELPKASPEAKIDQTIGLTHFTLDYSRPSVNGRKIFGELLPYGKVWRLGANASTKLTIDQPVKFGNQILPAGSYSVFAIPGEKTWEVVFNSDLEQWGESNYNKELNVVSLSVTPEKGEFTESLNIYFDHIRFDGGHLVIKWENTSLSIPFTLETEDQAKKNINEALNKGEDIAKVYYNASRYYTLMGEDDLAYEFIEKSTKEKPTHNSLFQKAKLQAARGEKSEAINTANKALEMAKASGADTWVGYIQQSLDEWKADSKK